MAKSALGKGLGALINSSNNTNSNNNNSEKKNEKNDVAKINIEENNSEKKDSELEQTHSPSLKNDLNDIIQKDSIIELPLNSILPNKEQPRKNFSEKHLIELVKSFDKHGIIQPLVVRKKDELFEIIAGERRFKAAKIAKFDKVPAIIRSASDQDSLEMAIIENIHREDLNPIEEAEGLSMLMVNFDLTQEDISDKVGKSRASVANSVRLLDLHDEVKEMVKKKLISKGHAKVILSIKDKEIQLLAANKILKNFLTVRDAEKIISRILQDQLNNQEIEEILSSEVDLSPFDIALNTVKVRLREYFSTPVEIKHGKNKGKIEIEYSGNKELNRVLNILGLEDHLPN